MPAAPKAAGFLHPKGFSPVHCISYPDGGAAVVREYPKGGLIGKTVHIWRLVQALQIPLYAANACYFIVLAVFPALLLFLGLLQYTTLEVERLTELLY